MLQKTKDRFAILITVNSKKNLKIEKIGERKDYYE